jgi:hypothetical protein
LSDSHSKYGESCYKHEEDEQNNEKLRGALLDRRCHDLQRVHRLDPPILGVGVQGQDHDLQRLHRLDLHVFRVWDKRFESSVESNL